jgi:Spy/CpxP family protein refolding chaperone
MKNNLLKYILIISLLMNVSFLGAAGYTHYKQSRPRATGSVDCDIQGKHLFGELSLNPEQIKQFQQKAVSFHRALGKKKQEVDRLRGSLLGLLRADNPDQTTIDEAISQINIRQHDMQKMVMAHILEFKSMLDKDQQKKFLDLIEGAMAKKKETLCP